jgi:two-component system response regulator NreC
MTIPGAQHQHESAVASPLRFPPEPSAFTTVGERRSHGDARDRAYEEGDTICVLLVEDHTVVREGLRALIDREDDMELVGESASAADAVELEVFPDVVLTDLDLPDARGDAVVALLRSRFPRASVFVLSVVDHPATVQQVLAAGANGYLLKTGTANELFVGIRAVAHGETFLQPSLGVKLARWNGGGSGVDRPGGNRLSPREVKVLEMVAAGHTNAEVAALLGVSLRTVETHRARVLQKLGHPTRAELVRHAYELGLVGSGTSR